jgi:hypothetical protein
VRRELFGRKSVGIFKKCRATEAAAHRVRARYSMYFRFAGAALILFVVGSWVVAPFLISQDFACYLSKKEWLVALWYPNYQYSEVLALHDWTKIDSCRLIVATSWASFIGGMLLSILLSIEVKFNETYYPGPKWGGVFLIFISCSMMGFIPFFSNEISDHKLKLSLFSNIIAVDVFDTETHAHFVLTGITMFSYYLLCEGLSITLSTLRSDIKKWRSS